MNKLLTTFLLTATIFGQDIDTLWTKSLAELGMNQATSMQLCIDGGYIISFINGLVKTDVNGNIEWERQNWEDIYDGKVIALDGGDFIFGGTDPNSKFILFRLDNNGGVLWINEYEQVPQPFYLMDIKEILSSLFITGHSSQVGTFFQIDVDGPFIWITSDDGYFNFSSFFRSYDDGEGFYVFGEKLGEGFDTDLSISLVSPEGNIIEDQIYNFNNGYDYPKHAIQLNNNSYVAHFFSADTNGFGFNGFAKINSGELVWMHEFENFRGRFSKTSDDGFIIFKDESMTGNDGIIKLNSQGEFEWELIFYLNGSPVQLIENNNGDYIALTSVGLTAIGTVSPIIDPIGNIEINEDEPTTVEVIASGGDELTYYAESDTSSIGVYMDGSSVAIGLEANWSGTGTITVTVTNENNLSDTTSFEVEVLPINDSPQSFSLVYPTIDDTIQVSTDTDETISFNWEESIDVDSDVSYTTTVSLDYFGNNYSLTYESNEPSVGIATYDWAVLMTNENIPRWTLEYVVEATDGEYTVESEIGQFVFENTSLSIDSEVIPFSFQLHQNYPNPFNPVTTFQYDLPEDGLVNITVYDLLGNVINNLVDSNQSSGFKFVQWNATNNQGQPVSAGVYLYTIEAGDFRHTKKMILLK
tara:strand:- start:478 stop:2400 length:1923 start_codon:yes stop_codon:yes gene_type:complete